MMLRIGIRSTRNVFDIRANTINQRLEIICVRRLMQADIYPKVNERLPEAMIAERMIVGSRRRSGRDASGAPTGNRGALRAPRFERRF